MCVAHKFVWHNVGNKRRHRRHNVPTRPAAPIWPTRATRPTNPHNAYNTYNHDYLSGTNVRRTRVVRRLLVLLMRVCPCV